jgi:hypothetical protein
MGLFCEGNFGWGKIMITGKKDELKSRREMQTESKLRKKRVKVQVKLTL